MKNKLGFVGILAAVFIGLFSVLSGFVAGHYVAHKQDAEQK